MALSNCSNWTRAIDVGAHVGWLSRDMALLFEHVHAFEPEIENFKCLAQNVPNNVVLHNVALGAERGTASLKNPAPHNSGAWELVEGEDVQVARLDDFHLTDVGFIKIDVQGSENDVIRGARQTIEANLPTILVETSKDEAATNKTIGKLIGYGLEPRLNVREDYILCPPGKGLMQI